MHLLLPSLPGSARYSRLVYVGKEEGGRKEDTHIWGGCVSV